MRSRGINPTAEIQEIAVRERLGSHRAGYGPLEFSKMILGWGTATAVLGVLAIFGFAEGYAILAVISLVVALLTGVVFGVGVHYRNRSKGSQLHLYDYGIAIHWGATGKLQVFPWEAIRVQKTETRVHRYYKYSHSIHGEFLKFGPHSEFDSDFPIDIFEGRPEWKPAIKDGAMRAKRENSRGNVPAPTSTPAPPPRERPATRSAAPTGRTADAIIEYATTIIFRTTRNRPGYDEIEVDDFIDRIVAGLDGTGPALPLDEIRDKLFSTTRLGPGYDEQDVDAFLDEIERRLRELR